jgi:hypothetical protein
MPCEELTNVNQKENLHQPQNSDGTNPTMNYLAQRASHCDGRGPSGDKGYKH